MWRTGGRKATKLATSDLLSISGLGALHRSTSSDQYSWHTRAGRGQGTVAAGSLTCSTHDDDLHDVVSQHTQLIQALSEKVLQLEDNLQQLHAEVGPALKLFAAIKEAQARQLRLQQDAVSPSKAEIFQSMPARNRDQHQTPPSCAVPADAPSIGMPARLRSVDMQQSSQAANSAEHAGAACRTLADLAGWHVEMLQQSEQQPFTSSGALGRPQGTLTQIQDKDECCSMHSFCTLTSYASTQVSGPALMTDLRPSGKAPSRAVAQLQYPQQQQAGPQLSGWEVGTNAGTTAPCDGATYVGAHCSSWPLHMGVDEECSPEEIQKFIELVVSHVQQLHQQKDDAAMHSTAIDNSSDSHSIPATESQQQEQQTLYHAISCLALHAECDEEVRQQLCTGQPAFLQSILLLVQGADLAIAQAAVHLIWYISRSAALRTSLQQQEQLLPVLLQLLAGQDVTTARAAAFALNNLAHDQSFRFAMVQAGAVVGLIEMLSGCDALGQEAAAAALMNLGSEESSIRGTIVACNGVQALVAVLKYGGPAAQEAAAAALENLSLDSDCEAALAAEGAIEGLLQVLKDGTTTAQAAAAGALRNLAVNEDLEGQLLAAGCVPVLVGLVSQSQEDVGVRTAALEGLRNLAASSTRSGDALLQAGGAAVLVDAARSLPAATARSAALGALLVLSMDNKHSQTILAAGAAGVLVHAALSGSSIAKEYAARALANLATTEAARTELLSEGAATVLSHLLKSQLAQMTAAAVEAAGCTLAAARALQNLSKCRAGCKTMMDAGCLPLLAHALTVPGPIATAAASALCNLCTNRKALHDLADCDGCNRLIAAVSQPKHTTQRGQKHALKLLQRLVKGVAACREAVQGQIQAAGLNLQLI